jgi:hypothetical protein
MNQPRFDDGPQVPLLTEGVIAAARLRRLVLDVENAAQLTGVREKGPPDAQADADEVPLTDAIERMLVGAVRAVQMRYRYDGQDWTDTGMTVKAGYRVVRCRQFIAHILPRYSRSIAPR